MKSPAHHSPQSTANKAIEGRERVAMRVLGVAKPSFQDSEATTTCIFRLVRGGQR